LNIIAGLNHKPAEPQTGSDGHNIAVGLIHEPAVLTELNYVGLSKGPAVKFQYSAGF
jgi:hypothetical protein